MATNGGKVENGGKNSWNYVTSKTTKLSKISLKIIFFGKFSVLMIIKHIYLSFSVKNKKLEKIGFFTFRSLSQKRVLRLTPGFGQMGHIY